MALSIVVMTSVGRKYEKARNRDRDRAEKEGRRERDTKKRETMGVLTVSVDDVRVQHSEMRIGRRVRQRVVA